MRGEFTIKHIMENYTQNIFTLRTTNICIPVLLEIGYLIMKYLRHEIQN
jgi:hypothetical protein